MERLEAAITKARQQQADRLPHRPAAAAASRKAEPLPAAWETLPEIALEPKVLKRNRIVTIDASPEASAFDILRTRTLRQMQERGWRRLAITSPTPGCGKSTLSLNLAFSIARQAGQRAIAIEMDMRRPSQERLLGMGRSGDATSASAELMSDRRTFAEVARRARPGLAIVTSARPVSNASDILLGAGIAEVLQRIEADYSPDLMIFDMPPMLLSDDTLAFMQHVDCVMIVAAAEASTIAEIDRCERDLASQTNVLGVVLNKCRLSSEDTNTYGYY